MDNRYPNGHIEQMTAFEANVKGFTQLTLQKLCDKGYSPSQSIRLIMGKELKPQKTEITWAIAEAILFVEMSFRYSQENTPLKRNAVNSSTIEIDHDDTNNNGRQ